MLALNGITSGELMLYPQLCDKKNKNKTRQNLLRYFFNLILVTQIVIFCGLAKATTAPASVNAPTALASLDLTEKERVWLAEHPVIRVANEPDFPPFDFISNGKPAGYSIEYVQLLAKRLGIRLEYVQDTWGNLLKKAEKKEVDLVHTVIDYPKERHSYLKFTRPYKEVVNAIVVRVDSEDIDELEDLDGRPVALIEGDSLVKPAKRVVPGMRDIYFKSYIDALKAVALGKVDATLIELPVASHYIRTLSLTNLKIVAETDTLKAQERLFHLAVRKDWAIFARILDKAMQSLSPAELRQLDEKWLAQPASLTVPKLNLTQQEKAWLAEHPVITLGGGVYAPLDYVNEDGTVVGIAPDYTESLIRPLGIKVNYMSNKSGNWGDLLEMLKEKKIDGIRHLQKTKEREEFAHFTKPITSFRYGIFVRNNTEDIFTLGDLSHKRVAVTKGSYAHTYLDKEYPDIEFAHYTNYSEALQALFNQDIDAIVGTIMAVGHVINEEFTTGFKVAGIIKEMNSSTNIGVRKDWPELVSMMNKVYATITPEQHRQIKNKWIDLDIQPPAIALTPKEQAWLAEHPRLRMGFDAAFPPFDFLGEDGQHAGIIADYLEIISERLGITIEPVYGLSWSEVLEKAKRKEIDLVSLLTKTEQRSQYMQFSKPFISTHLVLVTRDDMPFVTGLEDFSGKRVALLKNYKSYKLIPERYPEIVPQPTETPLEALKAIATGKVEGAVIDLPVAAYLIRKHSISNLKFAAPIQLPLPPKSIGVRDDLPMLLGILDKTLASISEEERQAIRQKWIALKYEEKIDYVLIWKIIAVSVLLLVLLLLWSWQTRRQKVALKRAHDELELRVQERTAELASSEDRLKRTQAVGHVGSWVWNLNKGGMFWSDETYRIFGYSPNKVDPSFELLFNRIHPDDRTIVSNAVEKALHEKVPYNFDFRIITRDGLERVVNGQGDVESDASGSPVQLLGTIQDITKRKQAEEKKQELLEQNRHLTQCLFGLQEAERRHLAQELHDELGQWLTAIQADAQLISNVTAQPDSQLHSSARAVLSNTNEVQKCVRDMIHQLRPSLLDELGLKESLREHVTQWQSQHTGTKCNISCNGDLDELGETLNITLYRIVQESLTNIAKHAQATNVLINLESVKNSHSPATLMLTIQDDGKGMDVDKNYLGMGLPGMRERVLAAGGEFNIQSSPEKGMRIEVCLPVTQQENVLLKPVY